MYASIYNSTSDNFKRIFRESMQIHPCSYDPTPDLRTRNGDSANELRCYLPLEAKALRFFRYCEENGKKGRILTSDYHMETFTTAERGLLCYVTVKADVFIDDDLAGSAIAGQSCSVGDMIAMDGILQMASGLAKSRALANAGFGVVDGTDVDAALVASQSGAQLPFTMGAVPNGNTNPAQGMIPPNSQGNALNAPNPNVNTAAQAGGGYNPTAGIHAPVADPMQASLFQQLGGQNDPLTQAKMMPYPCNGQYKGQTLGSLSSRTLEFLANKATSDPVVEAAVQAARLILADRNKANGKAN